MPICHPIQSAKPIFSKFIGVSIAHKLAARLVDGAIAATSATPSATTASSAATVANASCSIATVCLPDTAYNSTKIANLSCSAIAKACVAWRFK